MRDTTRAIAPDNIAPRITGTHKPLHHVKVAILRGRNPGLHDQILILTKQVSELNHRKGKEKQRKHIVRALMSSPYYTKYIKIACNIMLCGRAYCVQSLLCAFKWV